MNTPSSNIYDFPLEAVLKTLLYTEWALQVKWLIEKILNGEEIPVSISQQIRGEYDPLDDEDVDDTQWDPLSRYMRRSEIYDRIDTSNNDPHNNDPHSFSYDALPQSPYFLSVIELLQSGIFQRSKRILEILRSPGEHSFWNLVDALKTDEPSLLEGLSIQEIRKYRVRVGTLLRTIRWDNVLLASIQSHYSSSLEAFPVTSRRERRVTRNYSSRYRDNGLILESSFDFFADEDGLIKDEKWCLDRSMGWNAKIWYQYIFWSQPSPSVLKWTQEEIESVAESGALSNIMATLDWESEWVSGMQDLDHALNYYRTDEDDYSYTGYLWCYVQGIRYVDNTGETWDTSYYEWEDVQRMTKRLLDSLDTDLTSYREFIILCARVPAWKKRAEILLAYLDSIRWYFTPEFLLGWYTREDFSHSRDPKFQHISTKIRKKITSSYGLLSSMIHHLKAEGLYFSRFAHLVSMIEWEKWSKVTFDSDKKFGYTEGRHPNKSYDDQVPNPSHDDRPISIYSWANTSGKSWWLQRDFIIRRAAQTLWYAPVGSGNFPKQYDMMVYLDRASTNAYAKRSAYMEEIHRITRVLKECEGKMALVYIDEPFSTTAPADQVGMIEILIEKIRANGWDVVIATHNEEAMKSLQVLYKDGIGIYHYDYTVERDASWKPYIAAHRTLRIGIADAHSTEVAEIQNAPIDLIDTARSYLTGDTSLSSACIAKLPDICSLSDEARHQLINSEGLKWLYGGDTPRFHLYSADQDFAEQWIGHTDIINKPKRPKRVRYDDERRKENIDVSLWNLVDVREAHRLISQMLFASSAIPAWEVLERQAMFGMLAQDHHYRAILHVVAGLADIEESFETVGRWKNEVNHWLNPISIPRNIRFWFGRIPRLRHSVSRCTTHIGIIHESVFESEVNQALAYIEMNKKLLGKESPSELMQLFRELRAYRSFVEKYGDSDKFSVAVDSKTKKGEKYTTSYIAAFVDEEGASDDLSILLESFRGKEPEQTPEQKEFLVAASEVFRPFVPAWFSSLKSIQEYFSFLRQKVVDIPRVLPKRWYEIFETEVMQNWLYGYANLIANDITGIDISKRRTRVDKEGIWFGFWESIQSQAEVLTEDLLRIWAWKKEFPKLRSTLSRIDSPYIQSALAFLEDQYTKLCQFSIEKEASAMNKWRKRNRSNILHTDKKQHFRRFFDGKKEIERYAFTGELDRLSALCIYASYIAEGRLHPVTFNSTGEVSFPKNINLFESIKHTQKDDEPIRWNDFMLDPSFPYNILTGPNGSGKTYFAKSGIVSVLQALNTGYSQSQDATVPIFDRVIYFDRVNEQDGIHSSFANELEYWKEVWKVLEGGERTLLFCDEMFSTVPPKYQAAFSHAVMDKALRTWTSFITASHHHDWVRNITETLPALPVSHLSFDIIDGIPVFQRNLQAWHASSHAKEVARKLGFF